MMLSPEVAGDFDGSNSSWIDLSITATSEDGTNYTSEDAERGVVVPSFLQALLGVDFVPYLSEHTSKNRRDDVPRVLVESSFTDQTTACSTNSEMEETLQTPSCSNDSSFGRSLSLDTSLDQPSSSSSRKKSHHRLSSFVKGLKRRVTPNSNNSSASSLNEATTPKRKGRSPVAKDESPLLNTLREQQRGLIEHQNRLAFVRKESAKVRERASAIESRMALIQQEAAQLQQALETSIQKLREEDLQLNSTKKDLCRLEEQASEAARAIEKTMQEMQRHLSRIGVSLPSHESCLVRRCQSAIEINDRSPALTLSSSNSVTAVPAETPQRTRTNKPTLRRSASATFVRVNDLEVENTETSTMSSLSSLYSITTLPRNKDLSVEDLFFLDHNVSLILDRLFKLGFQVATDESDRFQPTRDTQKLLCNSDAHISMGWPIHPWQSAEGTNDVMAWVGSVNHGFGHDWPVVKTRAVIATSPRKLLDFLLDSTQIKKYNKMSQGRDDFLVLQQGIDTKADESEYDFAGEAKILRSVVRPSVLLKPFEMLSLCYTKSLDDIAGAYMTVSRSVWEDDSDAHPSSPGGNNMIRSEMLLGVQLLRSTDQGHCELTTITHALSPGVPELMAKRIAPSTAVSMVRDIQALFLSP